MGTPPIQIASLGMWDSLILMVMALVVFGPRRLPEIGRQIGKLMYEFRKASNDFKFQMEEELRLSEDADRRKKEEERLRALAAAAPTQPALTDSASPVSEAGPGAPGDVGASSEVTSTGDAVEESYPRIMPPSTGEQVAAARPNSLTALAQAANESGAAVAVEAEPVADGETPGTAIGEKSVAGQAAPDPEQAAHHG